MMILPVVFWRLILRSGRPLGKIMRNIAIMRRRHDVFNKRSDGESRQWES
jgi:hypothetical protein